MKSGDITCIHAYKRKLKSLSHQGKSDRNRQKASQALKDHSRMVQHVLSVPCLNDKVEHSLSSTVRVYTYIYIYSMNGRVCDT